MYSRVHVRPCARPPYSIAALHVGPSRRNSRVRVGVRVEIGQLEALEGAALLGRQLSIVRADGSKGESLGVLSVQKPHEQQVECRSERGGAEVGATRVDRAEVVLDRAESREPLRVAALQDEALIAPTVARRVREEGGPGSRGQQSVELAQFILKGGSTEAMRRNARGSGALLSGGDEAQRVGRLRHERVTRGEPTPAGARRAASRAGGAAPKKL